MQRSLLIKCVIMLSLMLIFLMIFSMMRSLVHDRKNTQNQVTQEIGQNHVRHQLMMTPFMVVPVETKALCPQKQGLPLPCSSTRNQVITPSQSQWTHQLHASQSHYGHGIYRPITYQDQVNITGQFAPDASLVQPANNQIVHWESTTLYLMLSDLRGLSAPPTLTFAGKTYPLELPNADEDAPLRATYVRVRLGTQASRSSNFTLNTQFSGLESVMVQPFGKQLTMTMTADWPHASFFGGHLPNKTLRAKDFQATWQNAYLDHQNTQSLIGCVTHQDIEACRQVTPNSLVAPQQLAAEEFNHVYGMRLITPVDIYLLTDRTLKYAGLMVLATFAACFLFETLARVKVHPIQYGLVGFGLAVFYLLLLALSEKIGFAWAYLSASMACTSLIAWYSCYVLQRITRGMGLGVVLISLYGVLYVILQSEDDALMLGSVLVFVLIALVMYFTRHVNWYGIDQPRT